MSAIEDAARERGYYATVAHLASVAPNAISAAITDLLSQDVEGIVIVAPRTTVLSLLAELPMDVPIVAAQGDPRSATGIPVASVNQEAGARMVLEHLIQRGHKRILHVAGPPDWNDAQLRLRAYKAELQAAGLPPAPPLFGDWTADSGFEIGRALTSDMASSPHPELPFTAVFSSNDQMALGLIHAFRAAGLDVPRDVSIVGFDDIPESAHFWPPLTTVRQDFRILGVQCVTMLLDAIHQPEDHAPTDSPASVSPLVEPQLVIRASVSSVLPAPADEVAARSRMWIWDGRRYPWEGQPSTGELRPRRIVMAVAVPASGGG